MKEKLSRQRLKNEGRNQNDNIMLNKDHGYPKNEMGKQPRQPLSPADDCAILLCGHGSRVQATAAQTRQFQRQLARRMAPLKVELAYLEFCPPTIDVALNRLARKGYETIITAPLMLFAGHHLTHDIPDIVRHFSRTHPDIKTVMTADIGADPCLWQAACARIEQAQTAIAEKAHNHPAKDTHLAGHPPNRTLLLVVGRGHKDHAMNAKVQNIARHLAAKTGISESRICFAGTARPDITTGLKNAAQQGWRDITVFPYLLFDGVLAGRVRDAVHDFALNNDIRIKIAPHIGPHPLAVEAMVTAIERTLSMHRNAESKGYE